MTLMDQVQQEAVDSKSDLGALLRKCKVLAARLGSRALEDWLVWESDGYPEGAEVPSYRILPLELKGHFAGPLGSGLRNAPIPLLCLPEKVRKGWRNYRCRQSVGSIEEILKRSDGGTFTVSAGDLAVPLGTNVYRGYNCVQAWAEVGVSQLIEILNSVRNRILDFVLAVWKEAPRAGEHHDGAPPEIEPARVTQIFNTTVYGGAASFVGSASNSPINLTISLNDFASLEKVLRCNGVQNEDVEELRAAVRSDPKPHRGQGYGPRVSSWFGKMMKEAAQGTWKVGVQIGATLLTQAISKYYGLSE
jgi:hypothetical protein